MDRVTVVLVQGSSLFRRGLAALLEHEPWILVVADIGDVRDAYSVVRKFRPDVVLIDLDVLEGEVGGTVLQIKAVAPSIGILILCTHENDDGVFAAAKAGANGFLLKDAEVEDLLLAIKLAASDQGFISPPLASRFLNRFATLANGEEQHDLLTDREKHILRLVARGATNREIASALIISENTVKVHLRNIFEKLRLRNRQEATAYAFKQRLVPMTSLAALMSGSFILFHVPCLLSL